MRHPSQRQTLLQGKRDSKILETDHISKTQLTHKKMKVIVTPKTDQISATMNDTIATCMQIIENSRTSIKSTISNFYGALLERQRINNERGDIVFDFDSAVRLAEIFFSDMVNIEPEAPAEETKKEA